MKRFDHARRQFLQAATLGSLVSLRPDLLLAGESQKSTTITSTFKPDVEIELFARNDKVSMMSGAATDVYRYHGQLLQGPSTTLSTMPSYLGPTLNLVQGQKVRIHFHNQLAEPCITHWHGMHVPQRMDGHPMYEVAEGGTYIYEFEVKNPAGTNWYHAHTHELTAKQVYRGLAGLIVISDEQEQQLQLPSGEYDLPIVIQDRRFTESNQLYYRQHGMHERMVGFLGDTILVNGQINPTMPVKTRAYRLRVFNGSNSRIYKLAWEDGTPLIAIGTDGALLEKPESYPYIMLAPAERVELWVDFSGREVGSELVLQSLAFHGAAPSMGMRGRMGGGMEGEAMGMMSGLAQGEQFPIAKFRITEKMSESPQLPQTLIKMNRLTARDASNPDRTIPIAISMAHMSWKLNGRSFEMGNVMDIEKIPVNTIQKIRIFHESHQMHGGRGGMGGGMRGGRGGGMGMMMSMAHPIHLHGQQFQILSRQLTDQQATGGYDTVKQGFINSGWKDTVLVMPGEEVTIIKPFEDYTGLYLYHCHNLEHEDLGMMRNFLVR